MCISTYTHTHLYLFLYISVYVAENHEVTLPFSTLIQYHAVFSSLSSFWYFCLLSHSENPGCRSTQSIYLFALICSVYAPRQMSCLLSPGPVCPYHAGISSALVLQACAGPESSYSLSSPWCEPGATRPQPLHQCSNSH